MTHLAHTLTVRLGADQGDGRHLVCVHYDDHVLLHVGLTYEDVLHIVDEFGAVERTIYDRESADLVSHGQHQRQARKS
jgi:hypothetical protein